MSRRYAASVDGNQDDIVSALRRCGCFVQPLHTVGGGVPDLLVVRAGRVYLLEVKDPSKPPSARKLTPAQVEWHAKAGGVVHVVLSVEDALAAVGIVAVAQGR